MRLLFLFLLVSCGDYMVYSVNPDMVEASKGLCETNKGVLKYTVSAETFKTSNNMRYHHTFAICNNNAIFRYEDILMKTDKEEL